MTESGQHRLARRATAAALVLAPALFLVDNVLHPKEYTRDHEAEQLAAIGEAYTRWQLAHVLAFGSAILFAAAVVGLAALVRRRQPRLGLAGGAVAIAGLLGLSAVLALDGFTWGVLGEVSTRPGVDRATVELVLNDVQQSEWNLPYYLTSIGFLAGVGALAVGAVRQRAVPAWAGALLALGAAMVATEFAIVSNAYFIAGAAVLMVGGAAMGAALARLGDEEWAAGGPAAAPAGAPPDGPPG